MPHTSMGAFWSHFTRHFSANTWKFLQNTLALKPQKIAKILFSSFSNKWGKTWIWKLQHNLCFMLFALFTNRTGKCSCGNPVFHVLHCTEMWCVKHPKLPIGMTHLEAEVSPINPGPAAGWTCTMQEDPNPSSVLMSECKFWLWTLSWLCNAAVAKPIVRHFIVLEVSSHTAGNFGQDCSITQSSLSWTKGLEKRCLCANPHSTLFRSRVFFCCWDKV